MRRGCHLSLVSDSVLLSQFILMYTLFTDVFLDTLLSALYVYIGFLFIIYRVYLLLVLDKYISSDIE